MNFDGKWSSPGGDVKVFENEKYCLKWYGATKKKLLIVRDDEQQNLSERMQSLATKSVNINSKTSTAIGKENNMAELHIVHDLPRPQSLLLISKAHKLRLKLLISEYRKLYSSAVIGGGGGSADLYT